jgi:hypothetical protein
MVRTRYYKYSHKEIEASLNRLLDEICLPAALCGKNSRACPTPNDKGHKPGGRFHVCKGKDLWALGQKRADVDTRSHWARDCQVLVCRLRSRDALGQHQSPPVPLSGAQAAAPLLWPAA